MIFLSLRVNNPTLFLHENILGMGAKMGGLHGALFLLLLELSILFSTGVKRNNIATKGE